MEEARDRLNRTITGACIASHVAATYLVVGPMLALRAAAHVLTSRYGASPDVFANLLVAERAAVVLLASLAVVELGTGLGLLRWRPAAIPRGAVLASLGMLVAIWSASFASLRIVIELASAKHPGGARELLLVALDWTRLVLGLARLALATWMVGTLATKASEPNRSHIER